MKVLLTVKGVIEYGRLREFAEHVGSFCEYRKKKAWAVPEVLYSLAGPMNTVLMLFRYEACSEWEKECQAERSDARYGELASKLPYVRGSIVYELYQTG
jgi:hypothetical protein